MTNVARSQAVLKAERCFEPLNEYVRSGFQGELKSLLRYSVQTRGFTVYLLQLILGELFLPLINPTFRPLSHSCDSVAVRRLASSLYH